MTQIDNLNKKTPAIANRSWNRELARSGGNSSGTGLRTETYTPTLLNQYSQRTEANTFDVMGLVPLSGTSARVTVNSLSTYRKNEYFQKALTVSNGSNPVWQQVDIVAQAFADDRDARTRTFGLIDLAVNILSIIDRAHESGILNNPQAGTIDDTQFAQTWVENRSTFRPRGRRALAVELRQMSWPQDS